MSSRDDQWWDLQAAEYVLGSLSEEDRSVFEKLLQSDPDVQRRVLDWEIRFDPLHRNTRPVEPSPQVFEKIKARVGLHADASGNQQQIPHNTDLVSLKEWREHVRFWRTISGCVMAAAAVLIGFLVFNPVRLLPTSGAPAVTDAQITTVSVLENESGEPIWAISYKPPSQQSGQQPGQQIEQSSGAGELLISALGQIPLQADQSHQLWMVLSDESGVQSVGLMPDNPGETKILSLPIELSSSTSFAVSLEPFGGVPGPEHGPVVAINPIVPPADPDAN